MLIHVVVVLLCAMGLWRSTLSKIWIDLHLAVLPSYAIPSYGEDDRSAACYTIIEV
jgi:hypothetical protein